MYGPIPRCRRLLLAWAALGGLLAVAWHLKHPLLYWLRPCETALLLAVAVVGGSVVLRRRSGPFSPGGWRLLAIGLLVLAGLTLWRELEFQSDRRHVLAGGRDMQMLGEHFIVGFRSFAELRPLAEGGLIGGIYLTRRNLLRDGAVSVAAGIAQLQEARRLAGAPPLIVAADQEGGPVAHLSPWLERLPALSSLVHAAPPETLAARARLYGERQGAALAALGVNLNLAPVVDLRPSDADSPLDFLSGIGGRAIDDDPAVVTEVARAYVAGLAAAGVDATLKHFPGLGRVRADTHLRRASLAATAEDLRGDWQPFRSVGNGSRAAIMLGHVVLPALDPEHAVSHSRIVVQTVLRGQWGHRGVLITDDLNMGAVYGQGIGRVAAQSLAAGVDLILVSYDPDQYYRALSGAARAFARGDIDRQTLRASSARLRAFGVGNQGPEGQRRLRLPANGTGPGRLSAALRDVPATMHMPGPLALPTSSVR
ncbi:glycoside hydrolase family 3 N-terminal domain-containing protein [Accumulibacter sp.]|uniref:glycoside hydrolase family 3 N-terminal domain-containing protein n=1 Tax=Accumulibacter sp. TaxID=2053492 RepID=UPI001ACABF50|nr:glycoside hydrolase family 3 N-terminal domain-containing protein [Accumulibacter sp.]MBN8452861.1 glycoside hydrolase family 3 protein [Accumulibacter sp.]